MYREPWLPLQYELLSGLRTGPVLHAGENFQVIRTSGNASQALLVPADIADDWTAKTLLGAGQCDVAEFGGQALAVLASDERLLVPVQAMPRPSCKADALGFADALKRTREKVGDVALGASIYVERLAVLLPVSEPAPRLADDLVLGRFLSGGVEVSCHDRERLAKLAPWISAEDLTQICEAAGVGAPVRTAGQDSGSAGPFELAGRAALQAFFAEHVVDIVQNEERYRTFGVDFPSAVVLHGPPGSGKTFAVETLVSYLKWPSFQIDASSIGSPYVHATGQRIAEVFEQAIRHAPSVVVIDEMEAFLADRHAGGSHRLEEVAEFLRWIPEAQRNRVLVIGMTNRIDTIDKAALRRGRFDHVIRVDLPTAEEIEALLRKLFAALPCEDSLSLVSAVHYLAGKPLSDSAFLVREAARRAARAGKAKIDDISLAQALRAISEKG